MRVSGFVSFVLVLVLVIVLVFFFSFLFLFFFLFFFQVFFLKIWNLSWHSLFPSPSKLCEFKRVGTSSYIHSFIHIYIEATLYYIFIYILNRSLTLSWDFADTHRIYSLVSLNISGHFQFFFFGDILYLICRQDIKCFVK